jgi:hypothetical protein
MGEWAPYEEVKHNRGIDHRNIIYIPMTTVMRTSTYIRIYTVQGAQEWDFELLDCHDFYMKSLYVGGLRDEIKI